MSRETERTHTFISHLLNSPVLFDCTPLQKEEQVLVFLEHNIEHLYPRLSSSDFFPGASRQQILALMRQELVKITGPALQRYLRRLVYEEIDFSYLRLFGQEKETHRRVRKQLLEMLGTVSRKKEARMALAGPLGALVNRIPLRYLERIYMGHNYVRGELEREKLPVPGRRTMKEFLSTVLLVRPAIYMYSLHKGSGSLERKSPGAHFTEQMEKQLRRELPSLPPEVVRSGVESILPFTRRDMRASSRLVKVFSRLGRDYRPNRKVDRGASPPEQSWFDTARHNSSFFGYDRRMLEMLQRSAVERGW